MDEWEFCEKIHDISWNLSYKEKIALRVVAFCSAYLINCLGNAEQLCLPTNKECLDAWRYVSKRSNKGLVSVSKQAYFN